MSLWLTAAEVCDLTGYKHKNSQKSALGKMGIPFVSRALDGFPMVQRALFQGQLPDRPVRRKEPNLTWLKQA
jgi:hypothetical protein